MSTIYFSYIYVQVLAQPSQCEWMNIKLEKNEMVAAIAAVALGVVRRNNYISVGSLVRHTYCERDSVWYVRRGPGMKSDEFKLERK